MSNAAASLPVERAAIRKVATRLVPFVALMFFINFLDRTAIGFAAPNGMEEDLALTATQFGFASGVFFIGYILLEVPSNVALHKVGARRWLARIMVTWGICCSPVHLGTERHSAIHTAIPARRGRGRVLPRGHLIP
jgi:nitrate/nitrite transporter NarK